MINIYHVFLGLVATLQYVKLFHKLLLVRVVSNCVVYH